MKKFLPLLILCVLILIVYPASAAAETAACYGHEIQNFFGYPGCAKDGQLHICSNNFQDRSFRNYVTNNVDPNRDGYLSLQDAENTTSISCSGMAINSLDGIHYFQNLKNLACNSNPLKEFDISLLPNLEVLSLSGTRITSLTFQSNSLKELYCNTCELETLSVTAPQLSKLLCYNNKLTQLKIDAPALSQLDCSNNNLLTLDVHSLTNLSNLNCSHNALTKLDLSNNTKLSLVKCRKNLLEDLTLGFLPELVDLDCGTNQLTQLDLSNTPALKSLLCNVNRLNSLDLSGCPELSTLEARIQMSPYSVQLLFDAESGKYVADITSALSLDKHSSVYMVTGNTYPRKSCEYNRGTGLVFSKEHFESFLVDIRLTSHPSFVYIMTIEIPTYCVHLWQEATCYKPKTCFHCSATEGSIRHANLIPATETEPETCTECGYQGNHPLDHVWAPATCTSPKHCQYCKETEGDPAPHDLIYATEMEPSRCTNCSFQGHPLNHVWIEATCTSPKRCRYCSTTVGYAIGHDYPEATSCNQTVLCCTRCSMIEAVKNSHQWELIDCTLQRCIRCRKKKETGNSHTWSEPTYFKLSHCLYCDAVEENIEQKRRIHNTVLSAICSLELAAATSYLLDYKRIRKY